METIIGISFGFCTAFTQALSYIFSGFAVRRHGELGAVGILARTHIFIAIISLLTLPFFWTAKLSGNAAVYLPPAILGILSYMVGQTGLFLAQRKVDASRVGIVGHSEGGLIAVMNAAKHPDEVAFIVSMAGPGVTGYELGMQQSRLGFKAHGMEPDPSYLQLCEEKYSIISAEKDSTILRGKLMEFAKVHENDPMLQLITGGKLEQFLDLETLPMIRGVFQYDPTENLKRVKCPMLAINGTLDFQVACEENLSAIARQVPHATVTSYEGLNHFFQSCDGWENSGNYALIPETMSPVVLKDIVAWLQETVK